MPRSLALLSACLLASSSLHARASDLVHPIGAPKDAGVYHVATGTWTRHVAQAALGADFLYRNDCFSNAAGDGYHSFANLNGNVLIDEGVLPGPTHPSNPPWEEPGAYTSYVIEGFNVSFCTDQDRGSTGSFTISFFQSYTSCTTPIGAPTFSTTLQNGGPNGLPGNYGFAPNQGVCWSITMDTAPGAAFPVPTFTLIADADATYDGTHDTFGVAFDSSLPAAIGGTPQAGILLAGNTSRCTGYDGTRWDPVVNYAERGTGMRNVDQVWNDTSASCTTYALNVPGDISAFYLSMFGDVMGLGPFRVGARYCFGDGTGTPCSCSGFAAPNPSALGADEGCANSINPGVGATLRSTGFWVASIVNDANGTYPIKLHGAQMPNSSCLYFQGTTRQNGGAGTQFGDGLRCAGGLVTRIATKFNAAGASLYPEAGDPPLSVRGGLTTLTPPVTRTYQAWYRNAALFCVPNATFNLSNGLEIVWN